MCRTVSRTVSSISTVPPRPIGGRGSMETDLAEGHSTVYPPSAYPPETAATQTGPEDMMMSAKVCSGSSVTGIPCSSRNARTLLSHSPPPVHLTYTGIIPR